MTENPSHRGEDERGALGIRMIGALKLISGLLLFAAWFGMFRMFKNGVADEIDWAVRHLKLDPDNRLFHEAIGWVSRLDRKHIRAIEAGTFFYALLHSIEGTGLLLRRHWASYLTIVATSSLVPFEGYEVLRKINGLKVLVLLVNIGFVVYLVVKLRQEHRERNERHGDQAPVGAGPQASREH